MGSAVNEYRVLFWGDGCTTVHIPNTLGMDELDGMRIVSQKVVF
jgi:hypothetical protein